MVLHRAAFLYEFVVDAVCGGRQLGGRRRRGLQYIQTFIHSFRCNSDAFLFAQIQKVKVCGRSRGVALEMRGFVDS